MDQIEQVRDFNRYYTRRLGVLSGHYLGLDRPWSESRLLYEIGDGADLRDLRSRLALDSGYLSRLLRSLEDQGLVAVRPHERDGRVRVAVPTGAGVRARADLEERARQSVGDLLGELTAAQRDRLIAAQREIRQLLRLATVVIAPVPDDAVEARACLAAYAAELDGRFPEGYAESALLAPGELAATGGVFLLAREGSLAVGCGAWQAMELSTVAEIRHLWVSGDARGFGLGRRLLGALEESALSAGRGTLRLGTHRSLPEAIAMYRAAGYREIPSYSDSPYNELTFEKTP
ncbi:bifunctional helix-turn-helix transcriptional regulator/GNAT family N-acetyltransferase [Paractinoplanes rishiriensis]|uniref:Transcriptional regulator, MarR family protein n=1 Tax=Paractinoplanes rishiriensis TaxID=1050105 RepID=A0A919MYC7_9ACTN|nr:bifunctional helix-turn-helix transcriptional regulator/GNAT family N-acetyltransferase [Actinoplanes rishiriensis]GIE96860.1 putative transcriptional regulator, MarR family protein [Actinoplanes rishiriensis]